MAMLPATPQFAAAVLSSHQLITTADLWFAGRLLASALPMTAGHISIDDDALIRARLVCQISDPYGQYTPALLETTTLNVYGHELHVRTGIRLPSAPDELLSAGWYRIQQVTVTERFRSASGEHFTGGSLLSVDALDRMQTVADSRFLAPEQPGAGATCLSEMRRLASGIVPLAQWPVLPDPAVPAGLTYTDSRRDALAALASAAGVRAYITVDGAMTIRPLTELAGPPVALTPDWTVHGGPDGGLYRLEVTHSRDGTYNAVVARGEQVTDHAPVQGIAYDTRTDSPTRWDGPYGRVPAFYSSPLLASTAQAQQAAQTRLGTLLAARDRIVTISAAPNPAVIPGPTIIRAVTPRLTYTGQCIAMTLPCGPAAASYTLRVPETSVQPTGGG